MHDDPRPESISAKAFLGALRRRWYVVVLCAVVAGGVAYARSKPSAETKYKATAQILYAYTDEAAQIGTGSTGAKPDPDLESATIVAQLKLPVVARATAQQLGGGVTQSEVSRSIKTTKGDAGDSFTVSATTTSPDSSARLANAYANQFVKYRIRRAQAPLNESRRELTRQLARLSKSTTDPAIISQRTSSAQRITQLAALSRLQDGDVQLAQRAEPGGAIGSHRKRDTLLGLVVGLIIGSLLAMLFDTFDRRMRSVDEVDDVFDRPLLGTIPRSRNVAVKRGAHTTAGDREAFQMLRANLRYANDDQFPRSLVVTSSGIGEGKTTVSWNLAVAAAQAGDRVLLIEADLRQPVLAKRYGENVQFGLAHVLAGEAQRADAIHHIDVGENGKRASRGIDVLFAGETVANPVDALESDDMAELVRQAEQEYDLVVVDTPPLTVVPDAMPVIRHVAGVVVVWRLGKTTSDAVNRLRDQLEHVGAKVLGIVANSVPTGGAYDYGYGAAKDYARA